MSLSWLPRYKPNYTCVCSLIWEILLLLLQLFYCPLSRTNQLSQYQKKHSPTYLSWSLSNIYHLLPSTTIHSILLVQFACLTIFLHNLSPSALLTTSWSGALHLILHTFLHPISVCFSQHMLAACFGVGPRLYHLFLVSCLKSLLGTSSFTLTSHIHLTILISIRWSATSFSFLTGQVSLPCSILLRTHLLYSLPLLISDISLLVSNGTKCQNLFHPVRIVASTAASASPSTLNMSTK